MQYLSNKPVQGIGRSKNLVNEDILIEYGAEKLANGEYYFKYASTPRQKRIWENTENYQGQLTVSYDVKYYAKNNILGAYFAFRYTDGTSSFTNNVNVFGEYVHVVGTSIQGKVINYIDFTYATGDTETYFKNIMLNEGTTALPYQPYLQRYDMYMYDNLIKQPYSDGTSKTINGITFTVDEETGWITANGTSTRQGDFYIKNQKSLYNSNVLYIPKGKYLVKGVSGVGHNTTYFLRFVPKDRTKQNYFDLESGTRVVDITYDDPDGWMCAIVIKSGAGAVNNLVFKPELIRLIGD